MFSLRKHNGSLGQLYFEIDEWVNLEEKCEQFSNQTVSQKSKLYNKEFNENLMYELNEVFAKNGSDPNLSYSVELALSVGLNNYIYYSVSKQLPNAKLAAEFLYNLAQRHIWESLPFEHIDIVLDVFSRNGFFSYHKLAFDVLYFLFPDTEMKTLMFQYMIEFIERNSDNRLEAIELFKILLYGYNWVYVNPDVRLLVLKLCTMLSQIQDIKILTRLKQCIVALTRSFQMSASVVTLMSLLALYAMRVSLGPGRAVIADVLYLVTHKFNLGFVNARVGNAFLFKLLHMMNDIDADVAIRAVQIMTELIGIRHKQQEHNEIFLKNIDNSFVEIFLKEQFAQVLQTILAAYMKHSKYPATLHAVFVLNWVLIMMAVSPLNAKISVFFILNLQKATLVYMKVGKKRKSFLLATVLCLLSLVGSVYGIKELSEMARFLEQMRLTQAPFLIPPVRAPPSILPGWEPSINLLLDENMISRIVSRWYEEVTREACEANC